MSLQHCTRMKAKLQPQWYDECRVQTATHLRPGIEQLKGDEGGGFQGLETRGGEKNV